MSIGSKSGLIYVIDIRRSGNIIYKLRGHDEAIVSLSWCPVPVNIFENKDTKELLLASGAKDRYVEFDTLKIQCVNQHPDIKTDVFV